MKVEVVRQSLTLNPGILHSTSSGSCSCNGDSSIVVTVLLMQVEVVRQSLTLNPGILHSSGGFSCNGGTSSSSHSISNGSRSSETIPDPQPWYFT